jgi:hypothetical protein
MIPGRRLDYRTENMSGKEQAGRRG